VLVDAYFGVDFEPPIQITTHYRYSELKENKKSRTPPTDKLVCSNVKFAEANAPPPLIGLKSVKEHYKHSLKEVSFLAKILK